MRTTPQQIENLAKMLDKTCFFDYLKDIKDHIADVRNPLMVAPEHEAVVRKAICEVIDDLVVSKFKVATDTGKEPGDSWT